MAEQHIHKVVESQVGDTVQFPVPDVDRYPNDLVDFFTCITKRKKHMTNQLATKNGIIHGIHSRNQK